MLHLLLRLRRGRTTTGAHHLFQIKEDTPPKPDGHPEMSSRLEAKWLPRVPEPYLQPPLLAFFTTSYCTSPSPTHTTPHTTTTKEPLRTGVVRPVRVKIMIRWATRHFCVCPTVAAGAICCTPFFLSIGLWCGVVRRPFGDWRKQRVSRQRLAHPVRHARRWVRALSDWRCIGAFGV